jgi:predicted SAM-dependent methyltransferase
MTLLLNVGCGTRFHPAWVNLDFESGAPGVIACDIRRGIPFHDEHFDAVYHSHVLEHFSRADTPPFLRECRRVLKSAGILRVVVPDLEALAATYLHALERASNGDAKWQHNYEYVMLELYDQTVRDRPGGDLERYLSRSEIPNLDFVLEQGGIDARNIIQQLRAQPVSVAARRRPSIAQLPRRIYHYLRRNSFGREALLRALLGAEYEALRIGRFRRRGEPHLWMYDRYSLKRTLEEAGFRAVRQLGPAQSEIDGWLDFHLDVEPDGTIYKPYSLYFECRK